MSVSLALPKLYDDVVALMATWAAVVSALAWMTWSGSSVPSIAGVPTDAAEIRVRFPTGGTVGVSGMTYQTSVDDGTTWGSVTPLLTATSIAVLGVTLSLAAGTITSGDVVRWTQTSPIVVPHRFGWRERDKHEGVRRVVWEPGDDGALGELDAARNPGGNPRSLFTLHESCAVYLEAANVSSAATAENEREQYIAARLLYDDFLRAVYLVRHGAVSLASPTWVDKDNIRRYGATIRVVVTVDAFIPDALQTTASASTVAINATTIAIDPAHDQTDTETVSPTDTP